MLKLHSLCKKLRVSVCLVSFCSEVSQEGEEPRQPERPVGWEPTGAGSWGRADWGTQQRSGRGLSHGLLFSIWPRV